MLSSRPVWRFGLLPVLPGSICGGDWVLKAEENLEEIRTQWLARADVFQYVHGSPEAARGCPPFWKLPVSHRLTYVGSRRKAVDLEQCAEALIRILSVLFGWPLQREDRWVHGRVYAGSVTWSHVDDAVIEKLLRDVPVWFLSRSPSQRRLWLNCLYIHCNLAPSYYTLPEIFSWQYTAFDAAWCLLHNGRSRLNWAKGNRLQKKGERVRHDERFEEFAYECRIRRHRKHFHQWVTIRNALVHEGSWGALGPGALGGQRLHRAEMRLERFTRIAILYLIEPLRGVVPRLWWNTRRSMLRQRVSLAKRRVPSPRPCEHC